MKERRTGGRSWEQVAAVGCFVAAILSIVIGFVFTTSRLLNADLHPLLHGVGLFLLIAGIPILILGGHFMDVRDRKSHNRREAI